jgi:hypothetical protein
MSEERLKDHFKIVAWNCRGILFKIDELVNFMISDNIDIVLLTETLLTKKINIRKYGLTFYRLDRPSNGGGVAIVIRDNIAHRKFEIPITNSLEVVAIEIKIRNCLHIIASAYKPPNIKLNLTDINNIMSLGNNVIIAGDLNCKDQMWYCKRGNRDGRLLRDFCESRPIRILFPDSPTFYPPKGNPSILDIVLAKGCHTLSNVEALSLLSSDHIPITFTIGGPVTLNVKISLNYSKANWSKYKEHINNHISIAENINSPSQIDLEIDHLTRTINNASTSSIPVIKTNHIQKNCLPQHILDIIKIKNRLMNKWRKNRLPQLKSVINVLINEIKTKIRQHKNESWESKLSSLTTKDNSLWQMSRALKKKTNTVPHLLNCTSNVLTYDKIEKANLIAETFAKAHNLTLSPSDELTETSVSNSLQELKLSDTNLNVSKVSLEEISLIIKHLKHKKSPGLDNINNTLLKHLPQKALASIAVIFNACLELGHFPTIWKTAKVIPIFKPGLDKTLPSSYRPISLLPSLSKILEKIILTRMNQTIDNLIPNEQFGFRRGHCTSSQLTRLTQHIRGNFNHKKSTGMLLLDFSKAFDVVWHDGIIHKLIKSNTPRYITRIIHSYLTNRYFSVHTTDAQSTPRPVPAGVPQGSILGPFLFNLFIHDIPTPKHCQLAQYADDTAIFTTSYRLDTISRRLQSSLTLLTKYYDRWKLKLNESKTEAILFTNKRSTCYTNPIIINNKAIPWAPQVKYLGLIMDSKLTWSKHIKHISNKTNIAISILYPLINRHSKLSSHNKLTIYKSIIRPIISYGCPAWTTLANTHSHKLQIIQNKCLKMIFNTAPGTFLSDLEESIDLKPIRQFISDLSKKHHEKINLNSDNPIIKNIGKIKYVSNKRRFKLPIE